MPSPTDVVRHVHAGCEWNPDAHRGALPSDRHFKRTRATVLVGGKGDGCIRYRLCADCAALPLFRARKREALP